MKIGLIGDYNATYLAHQAIPHALTLASQQLGISVAPEWIPTDTIDADDALANCAGIGCVPGSPYRSIEGALRAIRVARETNCPFLGKGGSVCFVEGSQLAMAYGTLESNEMYHCNYGMNPVFADALTTGPLRQTAFDTGGAIRGVELTKHPFFVGTLFQPERAALQGIAPPLVVAFLRNVQ